MATRDIKTRFVLEGEQEFKKAMTNSANAIKVLNSEEKLAEARFKATGDAEEYAAEKTRILKEKIAEQEKAVQAAEAALKALTDNGVDPNSRQVLQWRTRLNNAQASLYTMQSRLSDVESGLTSEQAAVEGADTATGNFGETLDGIGEGVDFQNLITSIDNITGHIEAVVKAAAKAAKAVWDMGVDAGKWADDLATAASQAGIDVETYQSWQYASQFIDTNVSDIIKSWQDIQKNLDNEEYVKTLESMGIAVTDSAGEMRSAESIFWDAIDYIHGLDDETEKASKATELFKNDWRNLNPLIEAGSEAYQEMAEEGRQVAVVSEENVSALGSVDDAVNKFNSSLEKLKYDALAALAPTFQSVAEAMTTAVGSLNEFIASEEGQAALTSLNEALSGLISSFLGDDGGKGTFESIVNAAKDAVKGLTDALDWISKNGDTLKGIILGLGAAWATLKVSKEVMMFVNLAKQLPLDKLGSLFGGSAAAESAGTAATGTAAQTAGAATSAGSALSTVGTVGAVAAAAYVTGKAIEARQGDQTKLIDTAEHLSAATKGNIELAQALEEYVTSQNEMEHATNDWMNGSITDDEFNQIIDRANEASEALLNMEGADEVLDAYESWRTGNSIADWILPENWEELGLNATAGLTTGIESGLEDVDKAGTDVGQTLTDAAMASLDENSPSKVFHTIGENVAIGLANGIYAKGNDAVQAAQWLARIVQNTVQNTLQIHSPSKVFERLGNFTGLGFAEGIENSVSDVTNAVNHMIGATTIHPAMSIGGVSIGGSYLNTDNRRNSTQDNQSNGTVHVTMVLDDEVLGDVMAPIVNDKIGAKIQATRR